jgi:hypothetical protein
MNAGITSTLPLIVLISMTGCSPESGTSPASLAIVGLWNQGANLRDTVNNQTHIHTGYFSFAQEGVGFAGTGEQSGFCSGPSGHYEGPLANGARYDIVDGVQDGSHVSFKSNLCSYEGTLSEDNAHLAGTASCSYVENGVNFVWTGDWLANREP